MSKKKILFVGQSLKIGGIERALVSQLSILDYNRYDVDLFLFSPSGPYISDVPPQIRIVKSNYILNIVAMTQSQLNGIKAIIRGAFVLISRLIGNYRLYRIIFYFCRQKKEYDVAISYFNDNGPQGLYYGCNLYVQEKVCAKKKIAWIHSDVTERHILIGKEKEILSRFDSIINVSEAMKRKFDTLGICSVEASKIVYNVIPIEQISKKCFKSKDSLFSCAGPVIVTVGRLEYEKSTLELLKIILFLKQSGLIFKWLFVGSGCLSDFCRKYIEDNGLEEFAIMVGQQDNPFPYVCNANLYVSGSKTESFGLSIVEALEMQTPVIALKYDAIDEVLDETNGIVVNDFDEMTDVLKKILDDPNLLLDLQKKTKKLYDYNKLNQEQLAQIL